MILSVAFGLWGQTYVVRGTIEHAEKGQVYLAAFRNDRFRIIDSMMTQTGSFYFLFDESSDPGLYRVVFSDRVDGVRSDQRFFEFIFNRENVEVYVASGDRGPIPYFDHTMENQVYRLFQDYELAYEAQVMLTYSQLPEPQAVFRYDSIQVARHQFMDSLTARYPDLYAIRMMNAFRSPLIPGKMSHAERIDTLKTCFFDQASLDDPLLLNAPVYTFKIIDYLSLYKVDTLSTQEQEEQFCLAVDGIMAHVSEEASLRSFVVDFLLSGFEMLDMETVQLYIADYYLDEACESDVAELVRSRMEGYKAMTIGSLAPDFVIRDMLGTNHQLSRLKHAYVLVIFWASTCEHCQEMLPKLHRWYVEDRTTGSEDRIVDPEDRTKGSEDRIVDPEDRTTDLEVVAISLDTLESNFERYTEMLDPKWIHAIAPQGWNGKIAADYYIYATPSLFLLDGEQRILARPTSFRQFQRALKKLGN
jgi:thiol-disulfide isomerase/thioredoxin